MARAPPTYRDLGHQVYDRERLSTGKGPVKSAHARELVVCPVRKHGANAENANARKKCCHRGRVFLGPH
jgi:hypothetical protein